MACALYNIEHVCTNDQGDDNPANTSFQVKCVDNILFTRLYNIVFIYLFPTKICFVTCYLQSGPKYEDKLFFNFVI